jgi:hypothetical protein
MADGPSHLGRAPRGLMESRDHVGRAAAGCGSCEMIQAIADRLRNQFDLKG